MNIKLKRALSTLLCLSLLSGSFPAWAQEETLEAPPALEIIAETSLDDDSTATQVPTAAPLETAEVVETATPTPDATIEASAEPESTIDPQTQLDGAIADLSARLSAQNLSSDYEKALWIYSMMLANISTGEGSTAYDAIVGCEADALGYARAMEVLMNAAGLKCMVVQGDHSAWIVANLDGEWTHLHPYADDASGSFGAHFGLTDAVMADTYNWNRAETPACTGSANCFNVRASNYLPFDSADALSTLLAQAIEAHSESLKLYNAAAMGDAAESIHAILAANFPNAHADIAENGCFMQVELSYDAEETATPAITDAPDATAVPEVTVAPTATAIPETTTAPMITDAPEMTAAPEDEIEETIPADEAALYSTSLLSTQALSAASVSATQIVPAETSITLGVGEKRSVANWTLLPEGAQDDVFYRSNSTKIATVNADGLVTAKKTGSTTITLYTESGLIATIKVTVKKAPTKITLKGSSKVMGVGQTQQLSYILTKSSAAGSVTFASSNPAVASVSEDGLVTALSAGEVTITATTYNGKKSSGSLQILAAPTSITPSSSAVSIGAEDSWKLGYTFNEGSIGSVSFASSNSEIASVDADGTIHALKEGSCTITITAHNGVSANCAVTVSPAPTAISISAASSTLGVGQTMQLATSLDPENTVGTISYKSSSTKIATVSANGLVTAKKTGTATITATTYNGKKATIKITVKKAPTKITLKGSSKVMGVGQTQQLSYTLTKSGAAGSVTFASSNPDVASVNEDGLVTALSAGEVTITATTYNGKKSSGSLQILAAPTSITPSMSAVSIGAEDSWKLGYTFNEGSIGSVSFASSDSEIASVDADGTIHALKEGSCTITITAHNGLSANCAVTVSPAPTAISITAASSTLGVGQTMQLATSLDPENTVGTISYKSSSTKIATVSANGLVTAKKTGTATITATTYNGKKATLKFTVKAAPTKITLKGSSKVMGVGQTQQLSYTLTKSSSAGSVTFASSNPDVASVNEDGLVTALSAGEVTITATTYNGKKSSGSLQILAAPTSITPSSSAVSIGAEDSWKLGYTFNEGSIGSVSFASSNSEIASVDADGTIHALKEGSCTITITTHNGLSANCAVTVSPAPTAISITAASSTLGVGQTMQLATVLDPDNTVGTISYKSSSTKIATVSANGLVTAKKTGTVTITATTYNGKKATLKFTVKAAPTKITLKGSSKVMGVGQTQQLSYTLTKSSSAGSVTFASSNPDVASVNEDGLVTALSVGEATITATTYNGKKSSGSLQILAAPTSIHLAELPSTMGIGQKVSISATLEPADCYTDISYSVISGDAVSIKSGVITAEKSGTATIRAATHVEGVYSDFTISVLPAPQSISFAESTYTINVDETLQLSPILTAGSYASVSYTVSKDGYFTIDENGLILPIQRGSATVTTTTYNGLTATVKIVIYDPTYPEAMELSETPPAYLDIGETYTPSITLTPSTAQAAISWTSSEESVCTVDANGKVTAISYGQATITGKSTRNPSLLVSFKIVVLGNDLCLTMPERRTGIADISKTLAQIKAVRASAYNTLEHLYADGTISKSDYTARRGYIERAFDMYLMPWMTDTYEYYWKAANSNDGLKDFKPGTVYYGLPYTQTNRNYNVSKAVSAGYYTNSGKGYYKMQGSKFSSREYPGNDCSSFVSMSIWGTSSSYSYLNTTKIASSAAYRTLSDWTDLRPGDILNKSGNHVVMFLYYANKDKSQIVIIEQGGGDDATNTISCSIRNVSYYTSRGYSIRRVKSLGY